MFVPGDQYIINLSFCRPSLGFTGNAVSVDFFRPTKQTFYFNTMGRVVPN